MRWSTINLTLWLLVLILSIYNLYDTIQDRRKYENYLIEVAERSFKSGYHSAIYSTLKIAKRDHVYRVAWFNTDSTYIIDSTEWKKWVKKALK